MAETLQHSLPHAVGPRAAIAKRAGIAYEEDDAAFWDDRYHERQKRLADSDDVFFAARDRKHEIKEQIKQLQAGLVR